MSVPSPARTSKFQNAPVPTALIAFMSRYGVLSFNNAGTLLENFNQFDKVNPANNSFLVPALQTSSLKRLSGYRVPSR